MFFKRLAQICLEEGLSRISLEVLKTNTNAIKFYDKKYGRNLIAQTKLFTLMLLTWPPDVKSPIHDHGGSECWLRVIKGQVEEHFYEKPQDDQPLKKEDL